MTDIKRIKKFDSHNNNHIMSFVVEFAGEQQVLNEEDIEVHLKKYFKIRENLKKEKKVRREHDAVNEAYEIYQALLILYRD